jgi:hypothetical protein
MGALSTNTGGNNIGIGSSALMANTSGKNNISIGVNSMIINSTGESNIALGSGALKNNTSGNQNCTLGENSMQESSTTSYNTAFGFKALNKLTSSGGASAHETYNNAFGYGAMSKLTTGAFNAGIGHGILTNLAVGDSNTAVGPGALYNLQYGNNNVGIGFYAAVPGGNGTSTGTVDNKLSIQNVIYGINMTSAAASSVSIGVIGGPIGTVNPASLPANTLAKLHVGGTLRIQTVPPGAPTGRYLFRDSEGIIADAPLPGGGIISTCTNQNFVPVVNASGSTTLRCSQIFDNGTSVGINTVGPFTYNYTNTILPLNAGSALTGTVRLDVNGTIRTLGIIATSDKKFKKDITPIKDALKMIMSLEGKTYYWKKDEFKEKDFTEQLQYGLIAQEVQKVIPALVVKDERGDLSMNYIGLIPVLIEAMKEIQSHIREQEIKIADLEVKLSDLTNKVNQLVPGNIVVKEDAFDINPNPVTQTSVVSYKLANATGKSMFIVYDLQGKMLKKYEVANKSSQILINKNDLGNGMYILSLVTNGIEVQSKRFLIAE